MAKYLVNGKIFNSFQATTLCKFKKERLPNVFDLCIVHVVNDPERRFYLEILDADDRMPIWAYELTAEDARKLCEEYKAINNFAPWRYRELTGFNV